SLPVVVAITSRTSAGGPQNRRRGRSARPRRPVVFHRSIAPDPTRHGRLRVRRRVTAQPRSNVSGRTAAKLGPARRRAVGRGSAAYPNWAAAASDAGGRPDPLSVLREAGPAGGLAL